MTTTSVATLRERAIEQYERLRRQSAEQQRAQHERDVERILADFQIWARNTLGVVDFQYVGVNNAATEVTARIDDDLALYYTRSHHYDYGWRTEGGIALPCQRCDEPVRKRIDDLAHLGQALSEPPTHSRCPKDERDEEETPLPAAPELPRVTLTEQALLNALGDFIAGYSPVGL